MAERRGGEQVGNEMKRRGRGQKGREASKWVGTKRNDEDGDKTVHRLDVSDPRIQHFARLRVSTRDSSGTSEDGDAYGADTEYRFDNGWYHGGGRRKGVDGEEGEEGGSEEEGRNGVE